MRRILGIVSALVLAASGAAAQPSADGTPSIASIPLAQRPTIAIRDLDFAAQLSKEDLQELNQWEGLAMLLNRGGGATRMDARMIMDQLAKQLTQMLTQSISDTKNFRIFERLQLAAATGEQDLASSNRAAPGQSSAQTGKLVAAQYVVTGSITKFGKSVKKKSRILGVITSAAGVAGGVKNESTDYEIGITLKVLDATTGENITTVSTDGLASGNSSLTIAGGGVLGGVVGGVFGKSSTGEREKRLGEAMQKAAVAGAVKLVEERENGVIVKQ